MPSYHFANLAILLSSSCACSIWRCGHDCSSYQGNHRIQFLDGYDNTYWIVDHEQWSVIYIDRVTFYHGTIDYPTYATVMNTMLQLNISFDLMWRVPLSRPSGSTTALKDLATTTCRKRVVVIHPPLEPRPAHPQLQKGPSSIAYPHECKEEGRTMLGGV